VLAATLNALCEADVLPGLLDVRAMLPPTDDVFVRRVPGHALWVWYDLPDENHVRMRTLTRTPPPPSLD
jgi:hypothetical protein